MRACTCTLPAGVTRQNGHQPRTLTGNGSLLGSISFESEAHGCIGFHQCAQVRRPLGEYSHT